MVQQHQASHDSVEQSQVYTQVVLPPPLPANKQVINIKFCKYEERHGLQLKESNSGESNHTKIRICSHD